MIDKLNQYLTLGKELYEEYNILDAWNSLDELYVQISKLDKFLEVSKGEEEIIKDNDSDYPYRLRFKQHDMEFVILLDDKKYEEYKKVTAATVTKKK